MSTGQIAGYVIGAVVGYFTFGTSYIVMGAALGGAIGGAINPPKGPKLTGPRLGDLTQQVSSYGAPIPRIYGCAALFGNIFWIENNALKETSKTEGGGKGGGGGAETTTFTYSATFALGLCEGPIDGVRRIWIGGTLIYDAGSNDISTLIASNSAATGFKIYYGDETQMPDPRMQAAIGVANCPAYRGLAYIVFYDLALADYGNTLMGAQVKVEVSKEAVIETTDFGLLNEPSYVYPTDVSQQTGYVGTSATFGEAWFERYMGYLTKFYQVKTYYNDVVQVVDRSFTSQFPSSYQRQSDNVGGVILINNSFYQWVLPSGVIIDDFPYMSGDYLALTRAHARDGYLFALGGFYTGLGDSTAVIKYSLSGQRLSPTLGMGAAGWYFGIDDAVFAIKITGATAVVKVWDDDLNLVDTVAISGNFYNLAVSYLNKLGRKIYGISFDLYLGVNNTPFLIEIDLDAGTVSRTQLDETGIPGGKLSSYVGTPIQPCAFRIYDGLVFTFWFQKTRSTPSFSWVKSKAFSTGVPLQDIVEAECLKTNLLTAPDLDVTSLTDTVTGYRISAVGALRAAIEPLQGAWPFDVIQSGYKVKFVRRGTGASLATIPEISLDARKAGDKPGIRYSQSREMDTQLPNRVSLTHLDYEREYDVGEQYAERLNTLSINTRTIEMPIVLSSVEAARMAEVLLYMYWLERYDVAIKLPPTYSHLEPADPITVIAAGIAHELRIVGITYGPDGIIEITAKLNENAVYQSQAIGAASSAGTATIAMSGPTAMALLDIPLLLDNFDTAGFPIALAGFLPAWHGATLFRSDDGGATWLGTNSVMQPATIARALNSIGAPADTRMIDTASVLWVSMVSGTLASVTELQMLNGANYFAYGNDGRWEIIAAETCALQGDGTYLLSNLLRGRFGTEWAVATHTDVDVLVYLNPASLQFASMSLNQIGQQKSYRAVSIGDGLDSAPIADFTYKAVNLECLSPVWLNGSRHPVVFDWTLTWLRRTRLGGEWRDKVDASLGETSEAYEVEIWDSTYSTLKRTFTGLTSPTLSYTSAQQVTDFGANQSTLYIKVYQLSANAGRGYPLKTSITR